MLYSFHVAWASLTEMGGMTVFMSEFLLTYTVLLIACVNKYNIQHLISHFGIPNWLQLREQYWIFFSWAKKELTVRTQKFCPGEAKPGELLRDESWAKLKVYIYTAVPGSGHLGMKCDTKLSDNINVLKVANRTRTLNFLEVQAAFCTSVGWK